LLRQIEDLYIPRDERDLRKLQRRIEQLDARVRDWANAVVSVLPRGLSLLDDETYILGLFLAQQRRLNIEIDEQTVEADFRQRIGRVIPFFVDAADDPNMVKAAHRVVSSRIESDIDRAIGFFCRDRNVPPISDPTIDWRVAIRYMAQGIHRLACQVDMKKNYSTSPRRFEISLLARDLGAAVVDRRRDMIAAFAPAETVPVDERL
jgi:hypothetical protein